MVYQYTITEWILFFFIYSLIGWIWESCYVSLKKRRWVNRGFIHGPFLPIYGTGAIVVLLFTIRVRDNAFLIFLFGMIGATVLEYVTGACMERLFRMRYWDYSNKKYNVNGYICLTSSLGWGAFSVLLVMGIHVPVERAVLWLPQMAVDVAAVLLTVIFTADFTQSFNEAMDLKEIVVRLTEKDERIRRLQKRVEVISAVAEDDFQQYQTRVEEKKEELLKWKEQFEQEMRNLGMHKEKVYRHAFKVLHRNPGTVSKKYTDALRQIQEILKKRK